MKMITMKTYRQIIIGIVVLLASSNFTFAQTGNYSQTATNIYGVNSYTNVTFTGTPLNGSTGTLSFQWIACHQPGFGASTVDVDILINGVFQNLANYSSSADCVGNSVNKSVSGYLLDSSARTNGGNIIFRFYIVDGCQAGVGCGGVNDPAVVNMTLTYAYSVADFTVNDTTICPGGSVTYNDVTPGGVTSRSWSFPGGTPSTSTGISPTITYATAGYYSVTLSTVSPSGNNTTTKTNLVHVYALPAAIVNAGGPVTFCSGSQVLLSAISGSGYTYKWKKNGSFINGAVSGTYNATTSGNFKAIITSPEGCSATSNTIVVTANANPVSIISAAGPVTFCPGDSVTLNAFTGAGLTYQWKKNAVSISGATSSTYIARANGTYTCKATNGNGCTAISNSIAITVNTPKATVTLQGNATFCQGGSVVLKANTGSGLTYQWLRNGANITGATDTVYTATITGNYKVIVTNNCGSSTSPIKTITVNSLPTASISANGPITFCAGSTVTLNAVTGTGLTYIWRKNGTTISGSTGASYVASTSGSYTVKVTNSNGCSSTSNAITVTVNSTIATISAGGPTTFCNGDSVVLSANSGTGLTYQWLKNNANIAGATSITYSAKTAGTYKVIVTNTTSGCPAISSGITTIVNCKTASIINNFSVTASPNPFTNDFNLEFTNFTRGETHIEIFSIDGRLVLEKDIQNSVPGLTLGKEFTSGVYLIKIKQGQEQRMLRIVKN